eukprot:760143-Hanusia_phi.AAC.1
MFQTSHIFRGFDATRSSSSFPHPVKFTSRHRVAVMEVMCSLSCSEVCLTRWGRAMREGQTTDTDETICLFAGKISNGHDPFTSSKRILDANDFNQAFKWIQVGAMKSEATNESCASLILVCRRVCATSCRASVGLAQGERSLMKVRLDGFDVKIERVCDGRGGCWIRRGG